MNSEKNNIPPQSSDKNEMLKQVQGDKKTGIVTAFYAIITGWRIPVERRRTNIVFFLIWHYCHN